MPNPITEEEYIRRAKLIHGDRYDYSEINYIDSITPIDVICKIHGKYSVMPGNHYRSHCKKCQADIGNRNHRYSQEEIIERCVLIWGDRFDYSELEYTGIMKPHKIKCNKCGTKFIQNLNNHLNYKLNGCPKCQFLSGFSKTQWIEYCERSNKLEPMVYIIRIYNDDEEFIKIGKTSNSISRRFFDLPYDYEELRTYKGSPSFVFDKEIELHREYRDYKYVPEVWFAGVTECFSVEIKELVSK